MELKPLTLLCGINNSGKSSILQSLLLMKQSNFESSKLVLEPYLQEPLVFNGLYANLGDWEDVIYRHAREEEIGFSWKLSGESYANLINYIVTDKWDLHRYRIRELLFKNDKNDKLNLEIDVKFKNIDGGLSQNKEERDRLIVNQFVFRNLKSDFSFELKIASHGKYQLTLAKIYLKDLLFGWIYDSGKLDFYEEDEIKQFRTREHFKNKIIDEVVFENVEVTFEGIWPTFLKINNFPQESKRIIQQLLQELQTDKQTSKYLKKYLDKTLEKLDSNLKKSGKKSSSKKEKPLELNEDFPFLFKEKNFLLSQCDYYEVTVKYLKKLWSSFRYIGPLREAPKRFYFFNDPRGIDIGINGENTALILALEQENQIPQYYRCLYQGKQIKEFELRDSDRMLEAVNWWLLECMKLPEIKSVVGWRATINQVQLNSSGIEVSLPDVGFGVSQILPILVECLRVKEGETILLEQPEIHLHPSLQSKLADFFISMAKSGKNLVIETHSEHLINRLCLRVAQAESTEIQSLLNPLFVSFDEVEQTSVLKKIVINKYGEIENWPVGFFDEDDSRELMEATLKKRMTQFKA